MTRLDSIRDRLEKLRDETVDAITSELSRFGYATRDGRRVEPPPDCKLPLYDPDEAVPPNVRVRVITFICGHWKLGENGQYNWNDANRPEDEPRANVAERVREREPEPEVKPDEGQIKPSSTSLSGLHPYAGLDYPEVRGPIFGSPPDPAWHCSRAPDGRVMWWPPSQYPAVGAMTGRRFHGGGE